MNSKPIETTDATAEAATQLVSEKLTELSATLLKEVGGARNTAWTI